ncbi:hypothetical protein WOLCODRAFT_124596, partial [Wolfiporia cocos MD-104 SS10]
MESDGEGDTYEVSDGDSSPADVEMQVVSGSSLPTIGERRRDIDQFFDAPYIVETENGSKKRRLCKLCGGNKPVVNEATTMRRHLQSVHSGTYHEWAAKNNFKSMLPNDIKKQKEAKQSDKQTQLDPHLRKRSECIPPYSHLAFRQATIEWLVSTDQPLQALEHPAFRNMIQIAARATTGVSF